MLELLLRLASPAGAGGRLSVLIFHRVQAQSDPLFPDELDAAGFDGICAWLAELFNVLPLDEALQRLGAGTLPARAMAVTFDDGYADNHDVALPILQRHGLSATFFVATGFIDGGRMWNDTVIESLRRCALPALDLRGLEGVDLGVVPLGDILERRAAVDLLIRRIKYLQPAQRAATVAALAQRARAALPDDLMMTSQKVVAMRRQGMLIGAHTVSHPILAKLGHAEALQELRSSKSHLEGLLGESVPLFAYPNGKPDEDYSLDTVGLVRDAGFEAAMSTAWGHADAGTDLFQVPRFTPWDRTRLRFALRLWGNLRVQPATATTRATADAPG